MKPHVAAIIPVRGSDPEIDHGQIITVGAKPLLTHTIEAATASRFIDRIIVSTDDTEVARLAIEQGAEAPFLRPASLSTQGVPLATVLQHALTWIEEHDTYRADLVVRLEVTHPMPPRPASLTG